MTALCRSIFTRYKIAPDRVLAHSDIAPARKQDPGEKFPWRLLADSGIGLWVKPAPLNLPGPIFVLGETDPTIEEAQKLLARFGYGVSPSGYFDGTTRDAVAAFQRHFRPARVDGVLDVSTLTTLKAVLSERDATDDPGQGKLNARSRRNICRRPLTARGALPIPMRSVGWTAARANAERWRGRKVRAPWTYGAG